MSENIHTGPAGCESGRKEERWTQTGSAFLFLMAQRVHNIPDTQNDCSSFQWRSVGFGNRRGYNGSPVRKGCPRFEQRIEHPVGCTGMCVCVSQSVSPEFISFQSWSTRASLHRAESVVLVKGGAGSVVLVKGGFLQSIPRILCLMGHK